MKHLKKMQIYKYDESLFIIYDATSAVLIDWRDLISFINEDNCGI